MKNKRLIRYLLIGWMSLICLGLYAQQVTVDGTVTDTKGTPLVGATILVKGQTRGTTTDVKGRYSISAPSNGELEVSYISFQKKTVSIKGSKTLHITLEEDVTSMNEVIVVGYGTQKKINLTGAVSQISGSDISDKATPNLMASLQGELPGVVVTQSSGAPGDEQFDLKIRGYSSVNNAPALVMIDGLEGSLEMLNPNDIESISVLKDAASASIYGMKASAGVILVTTKRAKEGKVKVTYNGSYSITQQGRMPGRLNSWEEYEIVQRSNNKVVNYQDIEWLKNPNINAILSSPTAINYMDNTNWMEVGLKKHSSMQRHSVSLNGGTRQLNYMISMGYYRRDGFLKYGPDNNDRFNFRVNLNSQINKYLSLSLKLTADRGQVKENSIRSYGIMQLLYRTRTKMSVLFPTGEDPIVTPNPYAGQDGSNPVDMMLNAGSRRNVINDFSGQLNLRVSNLVKGLTLDLNASRIYRAQLFDRKSRRIIWYGRGDYEYRYSMTSPNDVQKQRSNVSTDKFNAVANYDFKLGSSHNFHVLAGMECEVYRYDQIWGLKAYMPVDGFYSLNYGNSDSAKTGDDIKTAAGNSFFGRFNYNFREKYLIEANMRYDGSSRLAPSLRWQAFPSVSAGWVVSKENFFRDNVRFLNVFKLRGSWGKLGNAEGLGYYDYMPLMSTGTTIFGGTSATTYYVGSMDSPGITWEQIEVVNAGVDLSMFRNRLQVSGEYYWKWNKNMMAQMLSVPSIVGVKLPFFNVGELKTWGWEIDLRWKDRIGKDVQYSIGFNISDSQNKLVKYDGINIIQEGIVNLLQGYPLNTIWGYKTNGLYQQTPSADEAIKQPGGALTSAGDLIYVNQDGDPYITGGEFTPENPGDLVQLGSTDPRYTFGINLGLEWKNFSFSMLWQGVGKRSFLLDQETLNPTSGSLYQAMDFHRDYWTEQNTDAFFPRPVYKGGSYNYKPADRWVQNGAYLRLKNVQLSYKIPINKRYLSSCQVYVAGENLWETSKCWDVFDPEAPAITGSSNWYAFYRSVTFGLNVTF